MRYSPNHKKEFIFGSFVYHYDLVMQDRKTLSLTVKPDLGITLKCPCGADNERIESFLRRKWFWLEKQLSFFKRYQRKRYQKEYVSGEGFLYLGRQFKLLVEKAKEDKVLMTKGLLKVYTTKSVLDGKYTKKLLDKWYDEKIDQIFHDRYEQVKLRFEYKTIPRLVIRDMQKRWGSFLNKDTILLNPKLIHTPKKCIDYVIAHELCHMRHKNHDKNFYKFLKRQCPNWQKIKEKLETIGVHTR
ncbi:MAG: SprT family zinc-dependent metalloprotease [Pseudomonadota bacterium]